jgi:uncharacterized OB-fold protein
VAIEAGIKPLPRIDPENRPYFEGAQMGVLRIQYCLACERFIFFPRAVCPGCLSGERIEWRDASGKGNVYSYCIVYRPHHPSFYEEVPIIFAAIELEEGPMMLSEIREATPDQVWIGQDVEVRFAEIAPNFKLPVWRPTVEERCRPI